MNTEKIINKDLWFLSGGGEMGQLIREKDWSKTSLGVPESWPQSLRTMVAVMLDNPFGMYIAWGDDYTQLYNDGYRPILGATKHPQALGISTRETFEEIWHIVESMFDGVMKGTAVGVTDFMFRLNRYGYDEECYFDFSYSPIKKDNGEIGGVLVIATETTAKKIATEALKESNQRFRNTMKQAPVGMTILRGPQYIVEMANDAYLQLVDKKESEFVGNPLFAALPEVKEVVHPLLDSVLRTGVPYHGNEVPIPLNRHGKQDVFHFDFLYYPLKEEDGKISGIIVAVTEVTEKVETRKKIEERKRLYEAVTQNTPDLIYVFDLNYRFTYANEALLTMWGRKWDDANGKGLLELGYEPWHAEMHEREIDKIIKTKKPIRGEVSFLHATLGNRIYDYIFAPVIDQDGNVEAITGTTRDITEQVEARKKIEESESNLKLMIHQAPVAIAIFRNLDYTVEIVNKHALELWGRTEQQVLGKPIFNAMPELLSQGIKELLDDVRITGKRFATAEMPVQLVRNGVMETVYVNFSYEPLYDADEKINGIMTVGMDVTYQVVARKKVEDSEKRYNLMLMQSPFAFLILKGKDMVVHLANESMKEVLGKGNDIEGKPLLEVLPELKGQAFPGLLDNVYNTGIPFSANEMLAKLTRNGKLEDVYFNYVYQPYYEADKTISGVTVIAYDVTSSVIANKKIEEAEEKTRLALNSAELGVYEIIYSTDEMITDSRFKEIWGVDKSVKRNEYAAVIHPDDILQRKQAHEKAIKSGHLDYRARVIWKDESIHWVRVTGKVIYDSKANPVKLIGIIQDITDAVNAREKIEESKEKLNIVIDASELGTYELNLLTDEVIYSDKYLEIFGFGKGITPTHKELINRLHPAEMHMRNKAFKDSLVSGTLFYQAKVVWNDKSIHWVDVKGKVFYNEEKKPVKLIGTVDDITEEKNHEQELNKLVKERTLELEISSERFSKIFDENPVAMTLSEIGTNKILFANALFYKYFGYTKEEVIGHSSQELKLISPEEDARLVPILLAYLNETRSVAELQALPPEETEKLVVKLKQAMGNMNLEVLYTRKNGETFYAILSYDLIKIDNKTFTITSYQDVSEQKKAENKIVAYSKELERKNKEIEQFAYIASHDLQEPLRSISNFSTLLTQKLEAQPDNKAHEYLTYINGGAKRMSTLIFDLLEYSRIGKDTSKVQIDCNKMVHDIITGMSASIKECEAEIHVAKLPVLSGFIYLESVFQNLISNAIKFRKAEIHPIITISAIDKGKEFLFEIKDNGIGIEKEYYEKIFIIFQRLHTRREYEGTGIGLSQCKKIIELHGGAIWLESELGKGSTFKFTIPKI